MPITTAVSQETDQNYGPFKSMFRKNLATLTEARLEEKKSVSLQPWLVGLIVFGGTNLATGFELKDDAFSAGFSKAACLRAWAKAGAAPLTCHCLKDPKVSKSLVDSNADFDEYLLLIQVANSLATHALMEGGYNGVLLKVKIVSQENIKLTERQSKEKQK